MEERNKFNISDGNLKVLETIPKMMKNEKYRTELRRLCLDFLSENREASQVSEGNVHDKINKEISKQWEK